MSDGMWSEGGSILRVWSLEWFRLFRTDFREIHPCGVDARGSLICAPSGPGAFSELGAEVWSRAVELKEGVLTLMAGDEWCRR